MEETIITPVSPTIIIPKKNVILDATTLSTLMSCSRLLDFRLNMNLMSRKGKSNSLECGSLVHKVLESYYWHLIHGFPRSTAVGNSLIAGQLYVTGCPYCADHTDDKVKPECGHKPMEYPGMKNTPENSEGHDIGWRFALQSCEQYFDFYKSDSWVPIEVETVKRAVLYEDDEIRVMWKAKLDLTVDTNQGIFPCDHKTFKQRRDKTKLSNQFIGQCLLMNTRNVIVNKFSFAKTLSLAERFVREIVSYSSDNLIEWQSEILPYYAYKYVQYAENEYWPPDYTHCDNVYGPCAFKGICESDRGMREEELKINFKVGPKWDVMNEGE